MWRTKLTLERVIVFIYIVILVLAYFINYKYMYIDFFICGLFFCYPYITKLFYGPQYKIQKNIKYIYKKYKEKDILNLIEHIRNYYNKNYFSTNELLSRKFELEKNFYVEQDIKLGCFSSAVISFLFFVSTHLDFIRFSDKYSLSIRIIIIVIIALIIMGIFSAIIVIFLLLFLYLTSLVPSKSRSVKHYLREKELEILIKKLNEKLKDNCLHATSKI